MSATLCFSVRTKIPSANLLFCTFISSNKETGLSKEKSDFLLRLFHQVQTSRSIEPFRGNYLDLKWGDFLKQIFAGLHTQSLNIRY